MTDEKWQDIIGQIKDSFGVIDQRVEDLGEDAGSGTVEIVEFKGPLGLMKLERTTRPLILDKKGLGSKRIGSTTEVKYIYSETEKVHKFTAYRYDDNDQVWVEMKMERDNMIF